MFSVIGAQAWISGELILDPDTFRDTIFNVFGVGIDLENLSFHCSVLLQDGGNVAWPNCDRP